MRGPWKMLIALTLFGLVALGRSLPFTQQDQSPFYEDQQSQALLPQEQEQQQQQQLYPPEYPDVPEFPSGNEFQGGFTISCNDPKRTCVRRELCVGGYVEDRLVQSRKSECRVNDETCCTIRSTQSGGFDVGHKPNADETGSGTKGTSKFVTFAPPLQLGCAAALLCVEEQFCTMEGMISPEPVALTEKQLLRRVPLSSCKNPETGLIGRCCRDPNYVDPWPTGGLPANYTGGFDEQGFPTFLNIARVKPPKKINTTKNVKVKPVEVPKTTQKPRIVATEQPRPQIIVTEQTRPQIVVTEQPQQQITVTEQTRPHVVVTEQTRPHITFTEQTRPHVTFTEQTIPHITFTEEPTPNVILTERPYVTGEVQLPVFIVPNKTNEIPLLLVPPQEVNNLEIPDLGVFPSESSNKDLVSIHGRCGIKNNIPRTSGLEESETMFGEIPWQAMVLHTADRKILCSGVLIDANNVLTAANCIRGLSPHEISIKLGEWKLGYELKNEEPLPFEILGLSSINIHPGYTNGYAKHDLAVLTLSQNADFNFHINPLCLPEVDYIPAESRCIATGWGKLILQSHYAGAKMQAVSVDILNKGNCDAKLFSEGYDANIANEAICGTPEKERNNVCQADVGGPLACDTGNGIYQLSGVYSMDNGCQATEQVAVFAPIDTQWVRYVIQRTGKVDTEFSADDSTYRKSTLMANNQYLPPN